MHAQQPAPGASDPSPVMRYFLPGLVVGMVLGAMIGLFVGTRGGSVLPEGAPGSGVSNTPRESEPPPPPDPAPAGEAAPETTPPDEPKPAEPAPK